MVPSSLQVLDFGKGLRHGQGKSTVLKIQRVNPIMDVQNALEHRANTCPEESRKLDYRDVLAESEDKQLSKEEMKRYTLCRGNGRVEVCVGGQKPCFP